ncbi:hypothetical protein BC835DRAFT_1325318 [Cytidiella melzeri]|nr:hypothetical protein BC835DRAFT_1325318 [Cytidiella melzeri]
MRLSTSFIMLATIMAGIFHTVTVSAALYSSRKSTQSTSLTWEKRSGYFARNFQALGPNILEAPAPSQDDNLPNPQNRLQAVALANIAESQKELFWKSYLEFSELERRHRLAMQHWSDRGYQEKFQDAQRHAEASRQAAATDYRLYEAAIYRHAFYKWWAEPGES